MGLRPITQNPQRYTQNESDWLVQAEPQIIPIVLKSGTSIPVKPLIKARGIIVKIGNDYLISPATLDDIKGSKNPHFDFNEGGEVNVVTKDEDENPVVVRVKIGRTVPILEVQTAGLSEKISEQDGKTPFAGVSGVDYFTETDLVDGVPKGLIQQIDYTLTEEGARPADRFTLTDLNLAADYSIDQLRIDTAQEDGTLNQDKLKVFLTEINNRLKILREDFNNIKRIHYLGQQPTGSTVTTTEYIQVASAEESDTNNNDEQVVFKESRMTNMGSSIQTGGSSTPPGSTGGTPTIPGTPEVPAQTTKGEWVINRIPDSPIYQGFDELAIFKSANIQTFPRISNKVYAENLVRKIKIDEPFTGKKISDFTGNSFGNAPISVWEVYDIVDTQKVIGYLYVDSLGYVIKPKG